MLNEADFVSHGCSLMKEVMLDAIKNRGRVILGLSGGSTPKPIYEALRKEKIDWSKVWIFLVDDRYVRPDDPNSNQFLLRSTLLKHAPIPESQIIFPDTSLPLPECMALYEEHLKSLFQKGSPDLIILGIGDDGHIASLFPPLNNNAFGPKLVIYTTTPSTSSRPSPSGFGGQAGQVPKFPVRDRISVTMPILTTARHSVFFLKSAGKKRVWEEMMASGESEKRWPAKAVIEKTDASVIAQW